ncbi:MAG: DUF1501 domain-containing protein [Verrucomicrobia bacterium]|nr:DUF1501 domain-containing protein [Verrucomicrobiota bacterium]
MKESKLHTRREFLRTGLVGGALTATAPGFLLATLQDLHAATRDSAVLGVSGKDGRILVVLQLAGGNDGLNTVVPCEDSHYYNARHRIAIPKKDCLVLNGELGLHPALTGFKSLHDDGVLSIVQGVGYPNPNRSHFRSMEIWHTASDSDRTLAQGWIGRYFDNQCKGAPASVGICIGQEAPQAFVAEIPKGVTFQDPKRYRYGAGSRGGFDLDEEDIEMLREMNRPDEDRFAGSSIGTLGGFKQKQAGESPVDFLERTALDAQVSSEQITKYVGKRRGVEYPGTKLAKDLSMVGDLIAGGMPTRIYYVSQGGYDTHTNQQGTQQRLLTELGDALQAFMHDLKKQGNLDRVLLLSFSEFGRRVAENASGGTDHGTAAPVFIAGGQIRPGVHGEMPDLKPGKLDKGDLKFNIDFRSVYASILEQWMRVPSVPILGRKFQQFDLLG